KKLFSTPMKTNNRPLWVEIIILAMPLILSMAGIMVMQFVDALFLSWYSREAISAVVPAGMGGYLIVSPFQAMAGYTSTLVAHYFGAKKEHRAISATWQGIYCALASGCIVAAVGFFASPIFKLVGHDQSVQGLESIYFAILCWGAAPVAVSAAISGFFTGRGKTGVVMIVQLSGIALNAILAYLLIFGKSFFPEWGMAGAGIATITAQLFSTLLLFAAFLRTKLKDCRSPWLERAFNKELFWRLLRFGFPTGMRFGFEMLAWTGFILILGRIGIHELAASNIAFRLNGIAFFPVIGVGQAVAILVGQAQGRNDIKQTIRVTFTGFILAEIWMLATALIFVIFPGELYSFFSGDGYAEFEKITQIGKLLLQLVAIYCILDAGNIVFSSALQAAGDTKWIMFFSVIAHVLFLSGLMLADIYKAGIWVEWLIATIFVMAMALVWLSRFLSDKWRSIQVIERHDEVY
ncbi:MAG: MATE family efflux transporter, partial [Fibrobacterota bacterium]|nr:MATE family efflux transporter [Chitinispirillaceae bacterium]